jgi:hypothetical protein
MATHDYVIDNQSASAFRTDLNNALQAILTQNSNATAPATTAANMIWYDTANDQIKKRNEANSAWITLGTVDEGAGTFTPTGQRALASQAQAEAGSDNTTVMTPLRVSQAIDVLSIFTKEYVSSNQTITTGGLLTLAHSLGVAPKNIFLELVCSTAENNYSVSDVIVVSVNSSSSTSGTRPLGVYYDATNVYVRFTSSEPQQFLGVNKTTGVAVALTNANWRLRVRAFA